MGCKSLCLQIAFWFLFRETLLSPFSPVVYPHKKNKKKQSCCSKEIGLPLIWGVFKLVFKSPGASAVAAGSTRLCNGSPLPYCHVCYIYTLGMGGAQSGKTLGAEVASASGHSVAGVPDKRQQVSMERPTSELWPWGSINLALMAEGGRQGKQRAWSRVWLGRSIKEPLTCFKGEYREEGMGRCEGGCAIVCEGVSLQ